MSHHKDDPPCPECGERPGRLLAEIDQLRADLAAALEDRARFPDRPDGIGRMIEAHIGNLKHGKDEADRHAIAAMNRCSSAVETMRAALKPLAALPLWRDHYPDGPDMLDTGGALKFYFTPGNVRAARGAFRQDAREEKT